MSATDPLAIDVVSDVVCPWCFLGRRRLEQAIEMVPEVPVVVRWRPYLLDPNVPEEGMDRAAYMKAKFPDPAQIRAIHERLQELGRSVGIDYRFDAIEVAPNTLNAHRVIRWALVEGMQDAVVERLFKLYFEEGADLSRAETLVDAARDAGMNAEVVARLLEGDADLDAVREEIAVAQRLGVTGVPCFIFDNRYAVMGAQEAETLAAAIRRTADERLSPDAAAETD
ncbi:DsbA family oxidoreductase [Segnochrobactrum spirostomi]|uniref:DsbA family oxidoreductase n=1 Tax=Segnochrobactrum spirostomi TaxID=2608987 RepID=A0A6A7XYB5_9HYPH|nr:DsbA family oxidoreductase [Segnochrobactrum spirostomi]MQT11266.1 DsbA family oxidoreductase [Segnochrobactrum spirostomi]